MDDPVLQPVTPPIGGLTTQQRGRRGRIIAQTLELAGGGYDAVNVRLVAERAGVAVVTLYNYFPTKQHLLLSAFAEWLEQFEHRLEQFGDLNDGFGRLWQILVLLTDAMREIPLLADTVARSFMYAEDTTAVEVDAIRSQMADMFADVLSGGLPTEPDRSVGALLTDVLTSNLLALAHQRITLDEVNQRLSAILAILARRHAHTNRQSPAPRYARTSAALRWFDDVDRPRRTHRDRSNIVSSKREAGPERAVST